jgi:dethiobiotin synthase
MQGGRTLPRGIFVTGTDTNVGKTVVSAALMRRDGGLGVKYWKPIQTGIEYDNDTAEVQRLAACTADQVLEAGVRLPRRVSPHLAAKLIGSPLDIESLVTIAASQTGAWIVEGAGGVLVPLTDQVLLIDLIGRLQLPVLPALIVSRSGLGTINHTLMTIEALTRRALPIAGVVMVGPRNDLARENRIAIERYGGITVLGELPVLSPLTPEALGKWTDESLDPDGRLTEWLRRV